MPHSQLVAVIMPIVQTQFLGPGSLETASSIRYLPLYLPFFFFEERILWLKIMNIHWLNLSLDLTYTSTHP